MNWLSHRNLKLFLMEHILCILNSTYTYVCTLILNIYQVDGLLFCRTASAFFNLYYVLNPIIAFSFYISALRHFTKTVILSLLYKSIGSGAIVSVQVQYSPLMTLITTGTLKNNFNLELRMMQYKAFPKL